MTSETSYYDLIRDSWSQGMILVEHDIIASKETIEDLRACPHKWCVVPYRGAKGIWLDQSLGCTKLGPFGFEFHLELDGHPFPLEDWRRLDVRIANLLRAHRIQRHVHGLSVEHRHEYA